MAGGNLTLVKGTQQYTAAELKDLHVYDLYYKKSTTLQDWWNDLDSLGGTVRISLEQEME